MKKSKKIPAAPKPRAKGRVARAIAAVPKKPRGRTPMLPGIGDEVNPDVRDAGLSYFNVMQERLSCTRREVEAKNHLLAVMHENKLRRYFDSEVEMLVEIIAKSEEKLKVRVGKGAEEAEDAEERETTPIAENTMARPEESPAPAPESEPERPEDAA